MLKSGATPFLMLSKISPSVEPWSHVSSTRLGAAGIRSLPAPPSAVLPWQGAQLLAKVAWPAATDSGVDATGFLTLAASGFPCAAIAMRPRHASASAATIVRNRRGFTRVAPGMRDDGPILRAIFGH